MAAPTFGASGAFLDGDAATCNVAVPLLVAANSVVVVAIFLDSTVTVTGVPTGFSNAENSPVFMNPLGGGKHRLYVYWKRATGVDTGTYDFTLSASTYREAQAHHYENVVTTGTPFDSPTSSASDEASGTTSPAVSVTTNGADRMLIHGTTNWAGGTWTAATGFTKRQEGGFGVILMEDKTQAAQGSSGTVQATCTGNDKRTAWLGALIGTTSGSTTHEAQASVTGTAAVSPTGTATKPVNATLTGTAAVSPTAATTKPVAASVTATATITATANDVRPSVLSAVTTDADWILTAKIVDASTPGQSGALGNYPDSPPTKIRPYQANLACVGLARATQVTASTTYVDAAWDHLTWYQSRMDATGYVKDYDWNGSAWVNPTNGLGESFDSTDAYAATALLAFRACYRVDPDPLRLDDYDTLLTKAYTAINSTVQASGLPNATPLYHAALLLDVAEVIAGLWAGHELATARGLTSLAADYSTLATSITTAANSLLWDSGSSDYDVARNQDTSTNDEADLAGVEWHAMGQAWAVWSGLAYAGGGEARENTLMSAVETARPGWESTGSFDASGITWGHLVQGDATTAVDEAWTIRERTGYRVWPCTPMAVGEIIIALSDAEEIIQRGVVLSTTASITAAGEVDKPVAGAVSTAAGITATAEGVRPATAAVTATASITATVSVVKGVTATVTITATRTADATVGAPPVTAQATLSTTATLTVDSEATKPLGANALATATITAMATVTKAIGALVTAAAGISSAGTREQNALATLTATAGITTEAVIPGATTRGSMSPGTATTSSMASASSSTSTMTAGTAAAARMSGG
jgi:hypothetical protein